MTAKMNNERGSVIVLALFVVLFLALLMFSVELLHRSEFEDIAAQVDEMKAYYCAESGVERMMDYARRQQNYPPVKKGAMNFPSEGTSPECVTTDMLADTTWYMTVYFVKRDLDPNYSNTDNQWWVHSTGYAGKSDAFKRTIEAMFTRSLVKQDLPGEDLYNIQIKQWQENE